MTLIEPQDLEAGQIVMITATVSISQGFVGKLFKVLSVDFPYGVVLWIESSIQGRYTVDLREYTFAIPSKDYIEAAAPSEVWADVIDTEK